jgi:AAA family ATP:ADP antiporter
MLYQDKVSSFSYYEKLKNSKFRHMLWPIRSAELAKFVPMAMLMLTILLNQNLVRGLKDSLLITMVSPEVLGFIKLWGEIPMGILFVVVYTQMCNIMTVEQVFRRILLFFLCFFAIFGFVLFPNRDFLHPNPEVVSHYISIYPNIKWFLVIWGKWTVVLFYIMGELWPVIVFSLLFWQLANKITKTEEASRFYPFFSLFGQSNLLISGLVLNYFTSHDHFLWPLFAHLGSDAEITLKSVLCVILLSGLLGLILHKYIDYKIVSDPKHFAPKTTIKNSLNLSLKDSIKMVLSSKYLWLICLLLVGYGVSINIIEGLLMSKIREMYPNPSDFMSFQGTIMFWTGIFTLFCTITGSNIIRSFGWYWGAIITPVMILVTGGLFFIFVIMQNKIEYIIPNIYNIAPLGVIVIVGALQSILSKGTKYSLFDATKEMVYIPLDDEMKTKGKAAVEIVGAKSGKAISAIVAFISFTIFPQANYSDIAPILFLVFSVFCFGWIYAVSNLSVKYKDFLSAGK